jgi:hypothetical protein
VHGDWSPALAPGRPITLRSVWTPRPEPSNRPLPTWLLSVVGRSYPSESGSRPRPLRGASRGRGRSCRSGAVPVGPVVFAGLVVGRTRLGGQRTPVSPGPRARSHPGCHINLTAHRSMVIMWWAATGERVPVESVAGCAGATGTSPPCRPGYGQFWAVSSFPPARLGVPTADVLLGGRCRRFRSANRASRMSSDDCSRAPDCPRLCCLRRLVGQLSRWDIPPSLTCDPTQARLPVRSRRSRPLNAPGRSARCRARLSPPNWPVTPLIGQSRRWRAASDLSFSGTSVRQCMVRGVIRSVCSRCVVAGELAASAPLAG